MTTVSFWKTGRYKIIRLKLNHSIGRLTPELASSEAVVSVVSSEDKKSVTVTSTKDLSNVVLKFCNGAEYKFDDLNIGNTGVFAGIGENEGRKIVTVWVKSDSYQSGDGPGYGYRFDLGTVCDNHIYTKLLEIEKQSDKEIINVGETITYIYRVKNTGNVPLEDVTVNDIPLGEIVLDKINGFYHDVKASGGKPCPPEPDEYKGTLVVVKRMIDKDNNPVTNDHKKFKVLISKVDHMYTALAPESTETIVFPIEREFSTDWPVTIEGLPVGLYSVQEVEESITKVIRV